MQNKSLEIEIAALNRHNSNYFKTFGFQIKIFKSLLPNETMYITVNFYLNLQFYPLRIVKIFSYLHVLTDISRENAWKKQKICSNGWHRNV